MTRVMIFNINVSLATPIYLLGVVFKIQLVEFELQTTVCEVTRTTSGQT